MTLSATALQRRLLPMLLTAAVLFAPATVSSTASAQAPATTKYTVVLGDYLDKIARTHGTTWPVIHHANPTIKDPNKIYPGETILIPEASTPAQSPAPQPAPAPAPGPIPAPAPVAAPPAAPATGLTGCDLARSLINQYSWDTAVAYNVMVAESSCNPQAANMNDNHGTCMGSFGLFQLSCLNGQIYDPAANVAAAFAMWQRSGWAPWGATTCAVKVVCS